MVKLADHNGCVAFLVSKESGWDFNKIGTRFIVRRPEGFSVEGNLKRIMADSSVTSACSVKTDSQGRPLWSYRKE